MASFDSTDDQRTANNTVRHQYRVLTDNEKIDVRVLKDRAACFLDALDVVASHYGNDDLPAREFALARTKIEEAVMWAVKGITS